MFLIIYGVTYIHINIKSKLVSELLKEFISGICPEYKLCSSLSDIENPDLIIVDPETVRDNTVPKFKNTKVLLLDYGMDEEELINKFLCFRVDGIISASTEPELFKKALRVICEGQIWIENKYIKLMKESGLLSGTGKPSYISKRERDILQLLKEGHSNKEIASRLSLSEQTVKSHLSKIFKKFNVSSRSQLISILLRDRLI